MISQIRKAITAFVIAGVSMLVKVHAHGISSGEWWDCLYTSLAAGIATYVVPNATAVVAKVTPRNNPQA